MKNITITALLFSLSSYSQTQNIMLHAEVKDTTLTAYNHYYGNFVQNGFYVSREIKKDSIGTNKVRITKLFYWISEFKKHYIKFSEIEYLEKRKGNDCPESQY